ncbi:hypothetical protein IMG5_070730 [Ichthyophthirius multifiliis]|uniref:Transmembrane protein n=1 Tax=Ichthyophthirius multifiliis TaxID=5932 RepID=G0QPS6_ICHMU|nr:hypothetical protein IMG5_070730 [Ichthyophthirius multifiliis]EGR32791.1 hypothetical protein IMG5_070730 [Ichthyophthirius multifiliis]|eukprot:XP_004036777.1 hypothetical protein IMG5_070730 [Ichthyophthirius multifiliis]
MVFFNKYLNLIRKADLFGIPVNFNINQQDKYKTSIGGFFSLIMLMIVFIFFWTKTIDFLTKQNIIIQTKTQFIQDPPAKNITSNSFMFAIRLDQDDFIKNPFFNVTLIKRFDYLITLQGQFNSQTFQFAKFEIKLCDQKNQVIGNCHSEEKVEEYVKQQGGSVGVALVITSSILNQENSKNYNQYYLNEDHYFTFVPKKMRKNTDTYLRTVTIQTDESLTPYQNIYNENIELYELNDMKTTTELDNNTNTYIQIYLRASQIYKIYQRSYQKISDMLSHLGGFIQIIFVSISIIMIQYNKFQFTLDLANELYQFDFEDQQNNQIESNNQEIQQSQIQRNSSDFKNNYKLLKKNSENTQVTFNINNNDKNVKQKIIILYFYLLNIQIRLLILKIIQLIIIIKKITIGYSKQMFYQLNQLKGLNLQSKKNYIIEQFQRIVNLNYKNKLQFCQIFNFCKINKLRYELLQKSKQQISKDLDIFLILDKLQEIDKLKQIFLNEQQLNLFNFIQKPKISRKNQINLKQVFKANIYRNTQQKISTQQSPLQNKQTSKKRFNSLFNLKDKFQNIEAFQVNLYQNLQQNILFHLFIEIILILLFIIG